MGLDVVLEIQTNFEAGPRPKSVHSNAEDRDIEGQKLITHHLIGSDQKELFRHNPVSPFRKSSPSKLIALDIEDGRMSKRSSTYQGSREIRRMLEVRGGGKNLEPCLNHGAFLSFELNDSTPWGTSNGSVQFPRPNKEPLVPSHLEPLSPSIDSSWSLPKSNMEFLDLSFRDLPEERSKISISCSDVAPPGSRHQFLSTGVDSNIICEEDAVRMLSKSFSEKVGFSYSYRKEGEIIKSGHKPRFSSFKKMFNPAMKSKSLHSPSLRKPGTTSSSPDPASSSKHKVCPRSLLSDFSKADQKIDDDRASDQVIKTVTSPVYLHAILKWEFNHGGSSYEFSVKDPEDVLSAKTWKTENAFNWAYTFHCCKTKSNIIDHGKKKRNLQPSFMIGQMQVSVYLCSEVSEAGSLDNSVVTEFTLYDTAQARRSVTIESSRCSSESNQTSAFSSEFGSDPSTSYPWASTELQPNLEIAAIVTQIPFTKKEALENMHHDLSSSYAAGDHSSPAYVKVVTPSGRHGVPYREELGPSSLLDRWKFGGGCDCGGWDMGCPIVVFDNADNDNVTSMAGTQQPTVLFVKGKKEKLPALTITATGKGQYAVDFHAQLSTLQAFSICIAILHSSEASSAIGQDNKYKIYSNSLKLILEEEMKHIVEAVAEEEERRDDRKVEQTPPSFFLNPPFSPMGRV